MSVFFALIIGCTAHSLAFAANALDSAIDERVAGQKEAIASQKRIDKLAGQTWSMLLEFRQTNQRLADLRLYHRQLLREVENQRKELASLERQLANVHVTNRRLVPLMLRMVEVLEQFIVLDMPFLLQERKARLENLKRLMDRADVSLPEKYRRILEAYQIETDYGRTIEAYTGERRLDGQAQAVNFLRVGRVALLYESLDREETGYWDRTEHNWKALPKEYNRAIHRGLRIARNEIPPDLINLPMFTPTTGQRPPKPPNAHEVRPGF